MTYNTDVRPVKNVSQVLEVTVGLQPYRLLRMVRDILQIYSITKEPLKRTNKEMQR